MKEIECPLCKGKGRLEVKYKHKTIGYVKCPLCGGEKKITVVETDDVADVEVNDYQDYVSVTVHKHGWLKPKYVKETLKMVDVEKKYKPFSFCRHCFGEYVMYKDKLVKTI